MNLSITFGSKTQTFVRNGLRQHGQWKRKVYLNRAKGALIGLAVGDAVGMTLGEQLYIPEHSKS